MHHSATLMYQHILKDLRRQIKQGL